MLKTPILFLIFNRPDTTEKVFEKIKEQKPKYLYVAADGPRLNKPGEVELCQQTRAILKKIDWECEIKTLFREENLGCKKAVSEGITWFFDNVEEGIILEDDCLPSNSFFSFCEQMLEKYRYDTRVMQISGENPSNKKFNDYSYYFSKTPHIWGWASWRRAWKLYDVEFKNFDYFIKNNIISNIFEQKEAQKFWNKMFLRVKKGELNTWDYQWSYTLFTNNGLNIIPNENMISNIGFGHKEAAHTSENAKCANKKVYELDEIVHPPFVLASIEAVKDILEDRYDIHKKTVTFLIKREFLRFLKKNGGIGIMKEILDTYVENTLGEKKQAQFKFKQFEYNYKQYFPENLNAQVLDIGIGRGEMLTSMKNWGYKNYLGIDISKSTIEFCKSLNLNCELIDDTTKWLNENPEKYNIITLLDVLEHIKKEETITFLNSLKNALIEGGVLIIQTPNLQAVDGQLHRYTDFTHEFGYIENSLEQVLTSVGFDNVEFHGFEENVFGGFRGLKRNFFRTLIWKHTRFKRRMTGNKNPQILHPVFYAKVKK